MMNKMMKKAAAILMVGMMAMTAGGNTVWASSDSSDKEIEGWEVVGNVTCTPIEEYQESLDASAPSRGYVLDVQFVNSDVVDYYVSPEFYFDAVRASDNASREVVLINSENVYTPDRVLWPFNITVQDTVEVKAGQMVNVQYYINGNGNNLVCPSEYAENAQTAYDNMCSFTYGEGYELKNPSVACWLETGDELVARYQKAQAQYESQYEAQQEQDQQYDDQYNGQQGYDQQYDDQYSNQQGYDRQYDDQYNNQQSNNQQNNKDELLNEILGGLAENSINYFGNKIEEKTDGIIDKGTMGKVIEYVFGD